MGFKTANQYEEEKYNGKFRLANDGDTADVIMLYQDKNDVLIADVHYIKSNSYNGYVHCTGYGCPACANNIRKQTKLFIPMYNLDSAEIQFWDRTQKFLPQIHSDVFANGNYPNPSEFVYRITRHGAAGDMATRYQISAIAKNTTISFDEIMAKFNATFPEYYSVICKDVDNATIASWLNSSASGSSNTSDMPEYVPVPRVSTQSLQSSNTSATSVLSDMPESAFDAEELDTDDAVF